VARAAAKHHVCLVERRATVCQFDDVIAEQSDPGATRKAARRVFTSRAPLSDDLGDERAPLGAEIERVRRLSRRHCRASVEHHRSRAQHRKARRAAGFAVAAPFVVHGMQLWRASGRRSCDCPTCPGRHTAESPPAVPSSSRRQGLIEMPDQPSRTNFRWQLPHVGAAPRIYAFLLAAANCSLASRAKTGPIAALG
jgi:hypothetical protein